MCGIVPYLTGILGAVGLEPFVLFIGNCSLPLVRSLAYIEISCFSESVSECTLESENVVFVKEMRKEKGMDGYEIALRANLDARLS